MKKLPTDSYGYEPKIITLRLGTRIIHGLQKFALQESMRRQERVTISDIVKEGLTKLSPELFGEEV